MPKHAKKERRRKTRLRRQCHTIPLLPFIPTYYNSPLSLSLAIQEKRDPFYIHSGSAYSGYVCMPAKLAPNCIHGQQDFGWDLPNCCKMQIGTFHVQYFLLCGTENRTERYTVRMRACHSSPLLATLICKSAHFNDRFRSPPFQRANPLDVRILGKSRQTFWGHYILPPILSFSLSEPYNCTEALCQFN